MRTQLSTFLFTLLIFASASCTQELGPSDTDPFDYLIFIRQGTNGKIFNVKQAPIDDAVSITVIQYHFRDTVFHFIASPDEANRDAFAALDDALKRRISIYGAPRDTQQPLEGRVDLYMVWAGMRFKVTNPDLPDQLLPFDQLVQEKITQIK